MALGGGVFLTQNKILPGTYINFVSAASASAVIAERGYAALPIEMDWGMEGEVFTVETADFQKNSLKIFGYNYTNEALKGMRDLFRNIKACHFYKLNTGGVKAANTYATAKYSGVRGNDLKIVIMANEKSTEEEPVYEVSTLFDQTVMDTQTVKTAAELKDNDYVYFITSANLQLTAGMPLTGGTNGSVENGSYQDFLDKIESYAFNTLGCLSDDDMIKGLFSAFTKRMRDEAGVKFQCVLHQYQAADHEGIISVENGQNTDLVYWVTGVQAGCAINASTTNRIYDGEYEVKESFTQTQLAAGIVEGRYMFHKVSGVVRVLEDINTFVSVSDEKGKDFCNNQTVRVLDQIANDVAYIFNNNYLGKVPNDNDGRISLWNDIVKYHQEMERNRAIEDFEPEAVAVAQGDTKDTVVVTNYVKPVNAMTQLFVTIIVN